MAVGSVVVGREINLWAVVDLGGVVDDSTRGVTADLDVELDDWLDGVGGVWVDGNLVDGAGLDACSCRE